MMFCAYKKKSLASAWHIVVIFAIVKKILSSNPNIMDDILYGTLFYSNINNFSVYVLHYIALKSTLYSESELNFASIFRNAIFSRVKCISQKILISCQSVKTLAGKVCGIKLVWLVVMCSMWFGEECIPLKMLGGHPDGTRRSGRPKWKDAVDSNLKSLKISD